jgi:hypothetical protein
VIGRGTGSRLSESGDRGMNEEESSSVGLGIPKKSVGLEIREQSVGSRIQWKYN